MKVTKESANSNGFCGPAALSAITGRTVEECVTVLKECGTRKDWKSVRGVANFEMERALGVMGFDAVESFGEIQPHYCYGAETHTARNWPTLTQWLKQSRAYRKKDSVYLVSLAHHFIVIQGCKVWDNFHEDGRPLRKFMSRCRVTAVYKVVPRRHKLLGKPVRFWDNGWRHGRLRDVVDGIAHVEGSIKFYTVPVADIREEL